MKRRFTRAVFAVLMVTLQIAACKYVFAQTYTQYDRGTPPQHAAGVSSLGSYTSTELGTVSLSNGALNLSLPLGSVGGRGFTIPLSLNYSSKVWSVAHDTAFDPVHHMDYTMAYATYGAEGTYIDIYNRIAPGWTISGTPILKRQFGKFQQCSQGYYLYGLVKLTVVLPDKGEVELRDDQTDGAPISTNCSPTAPQYRGRRWHATDGSGIVFVSDTDNGVVAGDPAGTLITSEGMRYRFQNTAPAGGGATIARAVSITDHNGNRISINYFIDPNNPNHIFTEFVDQLGRTTKLEQNTPDPSNPSVTLPFLVTLTGYQGTPRYYKIKTDFISNLIRADFNYNGQQILTGSNDKFKQCYGGSPPPQANYLFPSSYCEYQESIDYQKQLKELVLPDGRSLQFKYNLFGEVAEALLPTGGKIQYDYNGFNTGFPSGNTLLMERDGQMNIVNYIDRAVVKKRTYPDGASLEGTTTYSFAPQTFNGTSYAACEVKAYSGSDSTGTLLSYQRHFFLPSSRYLSGAFGNIIGTGYSGWSTGIEWRTEMLSATGTVMAATEQDWNQRASVSWSTGYTQEQPANDNRVSQARSYLDNGSFAKTETFYDNTNYPRANNVIEVKQYDFDQSLKRRSTTSYLITNNGYNYATDDDIHLLRLPLQQSVFDAGGTERSLTVYEYDNYVNDGLHAPLLDYGLVTQHDRGFGAGKTTRGNATAVGVWLNTTGATIYTYARYDKLGNVISSTDALGNIASVSFADDFGNGTNPGSGVGGSFGATYALPTLFTSPPPAPGAQPHTARSQYDFATGLLTGFRDRNNVITQTLYDDPFNRPTTVNSALGVQGVENRAVMYYAPAVTPFGITLVKNDVLTAKDQTALGDGSLRSWTVTDGFGRTKETWSKDPEGDIKVETIYDGLGRARQTSNPFRPSLGEPAVYTTTSFDVLGRTTAITTPDGAAVTTSYSANTVTVTDQAGKARKSVTDALGRLTTVFEDPNGLAWETTYSYDTLDNLVKVTQGSQQRSFMYDSLKRLLRARNPEQNTRSSLDLSDPITGNSAWSVAYEYDAVGNLTRKTDARGVYSTYVYDALNRNTTIDYSDTASINPDVQRFYDGATKGIGRFWYAYKGGDYSTGNNVETTAIDSYDALGRPLVQRQLFKLNGTWSPTYQTSRTYNLAGAVVTQTYPSNRSVSYLYNSAGRTTSFSGNLGNDPRIYASGILYSSWGSMGREQFGTNTPVYEKQHYNVRGQLCDVRASAANDEWGGELGALANYYSTPWTHCGSGADNNGNLLVSQTIINSFYAEDRYSYDALNRLTGVNEYQNGTTLVGTQQYTYDRWGNRTINPASTLGLNKQFTVNPATNRLGVPSGQTGVMTYDDAGNLITDTYTGAGAREYDAENKMTRAWGGNNQWQEYAYNADGQRTRRKVDGQETWQIYGMDGELLAEYPANGAPNSPQKEYGYRNGQLLVTATGGATTTGRQNVALAANGGVASASSSYYCCGWYFTPAGANNGNRSGASWGSGEGWNDNPPGNTFPDWLQIDFNGSKTIDEIDVFTGQDNWQYPSEPTETMTFTTYGLTGYDVQYWNGSSWVTVPGGTVTGNNKVWRKFTFSPVTTNKIRVLTNASIDGYSRLTEVEAWGYPAVGGATTQWLIPDHLGTLRMIVDQTGTLATVKRHDFLPFGEELFVGTGGRSPSLGYSGGDGVRQQFTAKERDSETGLDYFGARYFASTQGRFTATDPIYFQLTMAIDPQRFNLYSYARNNPLKFIDPNGERVYLSGNSDWLRNNVLYEMVGGQGNFDQYFQITGGQVVLRDGVDLSRAGAGVQQLAGLVNATDNYLYFAGTDGASAADLFQGSRNAKGELTQAGKDMAGNFTCAGNRVSGCGTLVGTAGRSESKQPANLSNGDPVFAVIAYNQNVEMTQTNVAYKPTDLIEIARTGCSAPECTAQRSGVGQFVRPVSFFIHESTENQEFARQGRGFYNYQGAHLHAIHREAVLRRELRITGGFAGGIIDLRIPKKQ